jgi:indole-3-glycerol phosphate synthase
MDELDACSTRWRPSVPGERPEVSGFLDQMAFGSRERVDRAAALEPLVALRARCDDLPPAIPLARRGGFDLIAELKLRSPVLGDLGDATDDLDGRVRSYAGAGAAAVSVLTEPSRFSGSLMQLEAAAGALAPLGVPAMRKDFLVDPYQLYEARACGAGGALLIVRMLSPALLAEMLDCARELGLFVLVETFDEEDIAAAVAALSNAGCREAGRGCLLPGSPARSESRHSLAGGTASPAPRPARLPTSGGSLFAPKAESRFTGTHRSSSPRQDGGGTPGPGQPEDDQGLPGERVSAFRASRETLGVETAAFATQAQGRSADGVLIGVNSRDLQTLAVVPERLEQLAPHLPREYPRVAESGLLTPEDAARMVRAGYDMALVGGALMTAQDPGALVAAMLATGRSVAA